MDTVTNLPIIVITTSQWDDGQVQEEVKTFQTPGEAQDYINEQVTWAEVVSCRCPALGVDVPGQYAGQFD